MNSLRLSTALLILNSAIATASILPSPIATGSAPPFNPSFAAANTVDNTELEYA